MCCVAEQSRLGRNCNKITAYVVILDWRLDIAASPETQFTSSVLVTHLYAPNPTPKHSSKMSAKIEKIIVRLQTK
jgi:hypothetical protein